MWPRTRRTVQGPIFVAQPSGDPRPPQKPHHARFDQHRVKKLFQNRRPLRSLLPPEDRGRGDRERLWF